VLCELLVCNIRCAFMAFYAPASPAVQGYAGLLSSASGVCVHPLRQYTAWMGSIRFHVVSTSWPWRTSACWQAEIVSCCKRAFRETDQGFSVWLCMRWGVTAWILWKTYTV
jgi:hypothetical protein